jgi:hypothetical protein
LVAGSAVFGTPEADQGYRTIMQKLREQAAPRQNKTIGDPHHAPYPTSNDLDAVPD